MPVVLEMTGTIPEGLYLDSYKTDPHDAVCLRPAVAGGQRGARRGAAGSIRAERTPDDGSLRAEHRIAGFAGERRRFRQAGNHHQSVITNSVVVETELVPMKNVPLEAQSFVTANRRRV